MCHGNAPQLFPRVEPVGQLAGDIVAWRYAGTRRDGPRIAVLPDIYGCNSFYRGYAAHLGQEDARDVLLVDPFAGLGELEEVTREAAFARRHLLADREFVDRFAAFAAHQQVDAVVGFCLGGLYVFELARRAVPMRLVAYYPFPQGLPNRDPLDVPFDYLDTVDTPHTVLVGDQDASLGADNLVRLESVAARNPALRLHVVAGAGHGFLTDLTGEDSPKARAARAALAIGDSALLGVTAC